MNELDKVIELLQRIAHPVSGAGDAIDQELGRPPRTTTARNLADDPTIVAFRNELVDGLIRADTARQMLSLVGALLQAVLVRP